MEERKKIKKKTLRQSLMKQEQFWALFCNICRGSVFSKGCLDIACDLAAFHHYNSPLPERCLHGGAVVQTLQLDFSLPHSESALIENASLLEQFPWARRCAAAGEFSSGFYFDKAITFCRLRLWSFLLSLYFICMIFSDLPFKPPLVTTEALGWQPALEAW